ncbi:MAG: peptide deformylase [Filifactoraceae bacterium]
MGIREIRTDDDEILRKISRPVDKMDKRLELIIQDMKDTMYAADGVGLAAPQIGVLRRVFVIDIGDGPIVFINPTIIEKEGEQVGIEGCLSFPGYHGEVKRPNYVKVRAMNMDMEEFIIEGKDLFARAICHENDHLDGILYPDLVDGNILPND